LSDLCIEKCGIDVCSLIREEKNNLLAASVYNGGISNDIKTMFNTNPATYVFQYGGSVVRSFFTHRVYCVSFDFPHVNKGCEVDCGETLHGLGLTSLWSVLCRAGCDCIDIEMFERFGLDKQAYFKDFFWNSINRKSCVGPIPDNNNVTRDVGKLLTARFGFCTDDSLVSIQKRNSICEEEFYTHLLCVLSNTDSRDRFLITIAFMEALYRADQLKGLLGVEKCKLINDVDLVNKLFEFLSICFSERLRLANYLDGSIFNKVRDTPYLNRVLSDVDIHNLKLLIDALASFLKNNCIFMEVLVRHAARCLDIGCGSSCGFSGGLSPVHCVEKLLQIFGDLSHHEKENIRDILDDLVCGSGNSKNAIIRIIDSVSGDNILSILMAIINGMSWNKCD